MGDEELPELFVGDPVAQVLYDTLEAREAGTHDEIMAVLDAGYDYDRFGRWVDEFEDAIQEQRRRASAVEEAVREEA
jgi:hypothetical protein